MSTSQETPQFTMPDQVEATAGVYTSGTRAGYVIVTVSTEPPLEKEAIRKHLRLAENGELALLEPISIEREGDRWQMNFFSADISNAGQMPYQLELVWLGDDRCVLCDLPAEVLTPTEALAEEDEPELPREKKPLTWLAVVFILLFALCVYALVIW